MNLKEMSIVAENGNIVIHWTEVVEQRDPSSGYPCYEDRQGKLTLNTSQVATITRLAQDVLPKQLEEMKRKEEETRNHRIHQLEQELKALKGKK